MAFDPTLNQLSMQQPSQQLAMSDDPPPPTGDFRRMFQLQGRPLISNAPPKGGNVTQMQPRFPQRPAANDVQPSPNLIADIAKRLRFAGPNIAAVTKGWTAIPEELPRQWGPVGTYLHWTVRDAQGNLVGRTTQANTEAEAIADVVNFIKTQ
jgi:hypothetical protein